MVCVNTYKEVNIMNLNEEINKVNEFFSKMTNKDFENMLDRCGINEMKSSEEEGMELLLNGNTNIINKILEKDMQNLYTTENEHIKSSDLKNCFEELDQKYLIEAA